MAISIEIDTKAADDVVRKFRFFRKGVQGQFEMTKMDIIGTEIIRLARNFAPKFSQRLANSLRYEIRGPGKITIVSNARYSYFQEFGYTPHYVSLAIPEVKEWFEAHATGEGTGKGKKGYIFVSKFTPHVKPAIEVVRPRISELLEMTVYDYMRKNFGVWA